ncbi:MAG: hypothetical protein V3W19_17645 [Desulfatiglandales bacterium]
MDKRPLPLFSAILPEAEVKILDYFPEIGVYCLEIKGAGTVPEIIEKLQGSSLVEYAEPNYIQTTLDNPSLSSQQDPEDTGHLTSGRHEGEKNAD